MHASHKEQTITDGLQRSKGKPTRPHLIITHGGANNKPSLQVHGDFNTNFSLFKLGFLGSNEPNDSKCNIGFSSHVLLPFRIA